MHLNMVSEVSDRQEMKAQAYQKIYGKTSCCSRLQNTLMRFYDMTSYGKIYCNSTVGHRVTTYFASTFGKNGKKDLIDKTYINGINMFKMLQGRAPNQFEQDSTYRAAEEYVNSLLEKPNTRSTRHLLEITHPLLSIENTFSIAKRMSQLFKDVAFCSVSNYDESVFQLSIVKNGTLLTVHKIGDELQQMGMEPKRGNVDIIALFFDIPLTVASEFVWIYNPIDAEDLFFSEIVP